MDLTGIVTVLLILISCIMIYSTWTTMYRNPNLPLGSTPLPLIRNILSIKRGEMVASLMKLKEQYGSVYTMYFGSQPALVLCGYQTVKEALFDYNDEFGARGSLEILNQFYKGYGITRANGKRWRLMRTFAFKKLKNFGYGMKNIQGKIQEELHFLVQELMKSKELPMDPTRLLMFAVSNVLCSVVFGDRYDYNDESFNKFNQITDKILHYMSIPWGQLQSILPTLMKYVPGPHHKIVPLSEEMVEFIYDRVKVSQETLDPSSPRHLVDSFLIKMEEVED